MKYTKLIILLIISTLILSCYEDKKYNIELKGNTMGTYYLVSLVDVPKNLSKKEIETYPPFDSFSSFPMVLQGAVLAPSLFH